jgi:hypothetical protein
LLLLLLLLPPLPLQRVFKASSWNSTTWSLSNLFLRFPFPTILF